MDVYSNNAFNFPPDCYRKKKTAGGRRKHSDGGQIETIVVVEDVISRL